MNNFCNFESVLCNINCKSFIFYHKLLGVYNWCAIMQSRGKTNGHSSLMHRIKEKLRQRNLFIIYSPYLKKQIVLYWMYILYTVAATTKPTAMIVFYHNMVFSIYYFTIITFTEFKEKSVRWTFSVIVQSEIFMVTDMFLTLKMLLLCMIFCNFDVVYIVANFELYTLVDKSD